MTKKIFQSDSAFFEELCNQYYTNVYNYCKKLSYGYNSDFVEECTQNTFLEARNQIAKLRKHPNIQGWLYTTAKNQINMLVRKQYIRRKYESIFEEETCNSIAISDTNLDRIIEESIDINKIADEVLQSLSEQEYALYNDYYKVHLSVSELSKKYNISSTAVTTRIYRLKKKIKNIAGTYLNQF